MANRPIHVVESGGDSTGLKEFADGADSGVQLPSGTIANRNSSASAGETRFNTDTKKLEYYDGAVWQSSTFINVDDAEYDGVLTIQSTQYSRQTNSSNRPNNNGTWLGYGNNDTNALWPWSQAISNQTVSKFLPFGHPGAHSGATEADLRFGPVGYNSLESEKTLRSTPILELATNPPQTAMSNRYQNIHQQAGGIAFTVTTNDYFDNGYVPGGEFAGNRAFLSGITNFVEGNSVGYYGYDAPNNLLTFWNSTAVGGPVPWLSVGRAKYDSNQIGPQIDFFTGGSTSIGSNTPSTATTNNKGSKIRLRAGTDRESTTAINYEEIITTHSAINVAHHMSIAGGGGVNAYDDGSANYVMLFTAPTVSGRILQGNVNGNGYRLNKILIANGHGNTTDHRVIIKNSGGSNATFKLDQDNMTCAKINSVYPAAITNYTQATAATAVADIRHDSSFPSGGSDTTYTITPSGFIMFDVTMFNVSIGGSTGTVLFSNLQTAAI